MKKKITIEPEVITIRNAFEQFIRQSRAKNLADASITDYEIKIGSLIAFCGDIPAKDLNADAVNGYIISMRDRGLKDTTVQSYMRAVSVFCHYVIAEGYTEPFKLRLPRAETPIKSIYTDEELERLLVRPDIKKCSFAELRTWALVSFLIGTGCRISTAINVRISDVDFDTRLISFRWTKNKKGQLIPLSTALGDVLRLYLRYRKGEEDEYLFVTECGEKTTVSGLQSAVKRYNGSRGVSKGSVHAFRHSFARNYIINGGDAFRLQRILGHQNISMTQKYVALYSNDLRKGFDNLVFLDRHSSQGRIAMR